MYQISDLAVGAPEPVPSCEERAQEPVVLSSYVGPLVKGSRFGDHGHHRMAWATMSEAVRLAGLG